MAGMMASRISSVRRRNRMAIAENGQTSLGLEQFRDRLTGRKDWNRAIEFVAERVKGVNAEPAVEGRKKAVTVHDALNRLFRFGTRDTDYLSHFQTAARQKDGHGPGPVIATGSAAGILISD